MGIAQYVGNNQIFRVISFEKSVFFDNLSQIEKKYREIFMLNPKYILFSCKMRLLLPQ